MMGIVVVDVLVVGHVLSKAELQALLVVEEELLEDELESPLEEPEGAAP